MPKAKKTSKKDTSSFIKKVASAGRRGDTELAYLSPKARDLLKKLGGSGTRNPRTDLKEFFLPGVPQLTPEQIAQLQQQFGQPAAPAPPVGSAAADMTAVSGPRGRTGGMPPATQPFQSIAPPAPTPPAPTAQAPRTAAQELEAFAGRAAQQTAPQGGAASERAREDLTLTPGANRPGQNIFDADVTGCPPGHYFNPISQSCVPLPSNFDWRLGGSPADAARRAQEELDRRAQEEAARKAAEEEAARRAAEEAARKAAEEEAQRRAAEEAARLAAEEEARRRAEQDAQARRAAEEAARVAEEARRRQAEAEAARIAEEERRRREQEARAALPPPSPAPPSTPIPPGLVESPLPTPPPPAGTIPGDRGPRTHIFIDENRNGIDDRDEAPADTPRRGIRTPGSPPGGSDMRTGDFIDENLNGIDDRDEGKRESPGSGGFFDWTGAVDPNSDIGRLIARLRERGGKVGRGGRGGTPGTQPPQTGGGRPSPPPPPVFSPLPPREPGSIPLPDSGYVPTPIPTPGYIAAPLPQMPGAGTGTPFFNPNTGGLTPGTIPVSSDLPSLRTSDLPLQAIGQNPNLSPRVLGGEENLGYYTDRFGNIILSPGAVRPPGFAKGGSADADLLKELEEFREAEGLKDIDSARAMLERLSNEPATSSTEVSVSPLAQSVKRTSRTPIRQQTDRGTAKGMAMELEEVTQSRDQGPRAKRQTEDLRQRMELLRNTLGMPTLSKATLAREGDLMARRFNEGGDVKKKQDETATAPGVRRTLPLQVRTYLESVRDPSKRTEPISEKDLDQEELDKLRDVIELAERSGIAPPGVVNYDVHELQRRQTMGATPLADTDFSIFPSANLRNTFGQFTFERLPDGTLIVKDSYDYEGDVGEKFNPLIRYANKKGVDRPVNIRIPPVKRAEGSPEEGETTEDFIRRLEEYTPYNLMGRAAEGLRNQVTGLVELPGAALDFGRGALQKVRELSPEEFRGSAPAMDTQSVDAFIAAAQRAKEDPKGEAAKMLASVGDYLKEGTSSPGNFAQMLGENLPLPGPRTGTGPRTEVVKPKGGDFPKELAPFKGTSSWHNLTYEVPSSVHYFDPDPIRTKDRTELVPAINNWMNTKLDRYIRTEMATPEDPIRKLAEQDILHVAPEVLTVRYEHNPVLEARNPTTFFKRQSLGKSDVARAWEEASDGALSIHGAQGIVDQAGNSSSFAHSIFKDILQQDPWIATVAQKDPNRPIYLPARSTGLDLGFSHLRDELYNSLRSGSDLPQQLRMTPEQLGRMSVPDAVRHVSKINKWRVKQKAEANFALANNAATVPFKDYPDQKFGWFQLKADTPEGREALENALNYEGDMMGHCVGGYCEEVLSGQSEIYSLRNKKTGEPHVTIEVKQLIQPGDFYYQTADQGLIPRFPGVPPSFISRLDEAEKSGKPFNWEQIIKESPEYQALPKTILQIKGKADLKPNARYIPFVQDFVRSQNWMDVRELRNTDLVDLRDTASTQNWINTKMATHVAPEVLKSLQDEGVRFATIEELNARHSAMVKERVAARKAAEPPEQKAARQQLRELRRAERRQQRQNNAEGPE